MTDVYTIITDRVVQMLDKGICPWRSPYQYTQPLNIISKQSYHGINSILLMCMQAYKQHKSNYWLTFKQAQDLGGKVKRGEHGCPVIYFNVREYETGQSDDDGNEITEKVPFIRYYTVFNLDQCQDVDLDKAKICSTSNETIANAEQIIDNMPNRPEIVSINQSVAFYRQTDDIVNLPDINNFVDSNAYYATAFHELVHSTGHSSRLGRNSLKELMNFCQSKQEYAKEELVAELGATMLQAHCGIANDSSIENHAAYCASWAKVLKQRDNRKLLIQAGALAQKAVNYILNIQA